MKRLACLLLLIVVVAGPATGQYSLNWIDHSLIDPANDVTRSLDYHPQTDHVLVATRLYGTDVMILDAATGDSLGRMDTEGITGGTYPINQVAVADDGTIYVCNLSAPQYSPTSTLRVYRYADEQSAPELVFDDVLEGERYGDAFTAVGTGDEKRLYVSGMNGPKIAVLLDSGESTLTLESTIDLPTPGMARHGLSPVSSGGPVWVNAAGPLFYPSLIHPDGTLMAQVPDSLASPGGTSTVLWTSLGAYNLLTVVNAYSVTIRSIRTFTDDLGTVTFDYFGQDSDTLMLSYKGAINSNGNATGDLAYDSRRNAMLTLVGMNSIASVSLEDLLKTSTPRDSALTVSIDGQNDFFPTDHIGSSNDREFYFTWSEGKLFAGVTGHTLVDPDGQNFLFWAFDLDPEGDQGSTTSPRNTGGITAYPFQADLVMMVEPWEQPDYMIGSIFKWDGSAWQENQFDGNFASQGALAYADEGEGKLAEMALIKNDAGIGTDPGALSMLAYVGTQTDPGEILSAFPEENPVGSNAALPYYYHIPELGDDLFPVDPQVVMVREGDVTAVESSGGTQPERYALGQNYPNPFNPETTIGFHLPTPGKVTLEVFDLLGRRQTTLVQSSMSAGSHQVVFDARSLSSGVYHYKMTVDGIVVDVRKMILLK